MGEDWKDDIRLARVSKSISGRQAGLSICKAERARSPLRSYLQTTQAEPTSQQHFLGNEHFQHWGLG